MAASLLALSAACSKESAPEPAPEHPHGAFRLGPASPQRSFIKTEVVRANASGPTVRLTGRVGFDENHTQRVASPIDGRATKILVELGDPVRPGQALLELLSPHVSELQADAQKAAQDLDVAKKASERAHKLMQEGAISEKELAQIEADYRKAKADAARSDAQLRSLSLSPSGSAVTVALRAQIGGTVVERNILLGQEVRADAPNPLLTISELGTVWVLADVYEQDLALVRSGAAVQVTVAAYPGESFAGTVEHVGDVVDPTSRTVKLRCSVPNRDSKLKPEMFAQIELLDAAGAKSIMLPSAAVLTDSEHTRVLVARNDGSFKLRDVHVGPEVDGRVRILDGVTPGETVVTEGAIFLERQMEDD